MKEHHLDSPKDVASKKGEGVEPFNERGDQSVKTMRLEE